LITFEAETDKQAQHAVSTDPFLRYGLLQGHWLKQEWTRAVTIRPARRRFGRGWSRWATGGGGFYAPEWIDRYFWRIGGHNANQLLPECQQVTVGDIIADAPGYARLLAGQAGRARGPWSTGRAATPGRGQPLDPAHPQALAHREAALLASGTYLYFSWAFVLREPVAGRTRLLLRTRATYAPRWRPRSRWAGRRLPGHARAPPDQTPGRAPPQPGSRDGGCRCTSWKRTPRRRRSPRRHPSASPPRCSCWPPTMPGSDSGHLERAQVHNLTAAAATPLERAAAAPAGRTALTLVPGAGGPLKQTLLALRGGMQLAEHDAPGAATLQVLQGWVRLVTSEEGWELGPGRPLAAPAQPTPAGKLGGRRRALDRGRATIRLRETPGDLSGSRSETHQHFSPADANCCQSLLLDPDATIGIDLHKRLFLLVTGRGEKPPRFSLPWMRSTD
jgi:quercetin dioxygenase-like cupin family protein